ncbi:hypothetical protein ACFVAV_06145 [Nocardia sp. NPDC057663]|uniref:hypothetical protein n=1 Tax=Nocardia sp. NPDC057663 TaxID=3346201 RepID=UPI00366E2BF3
MGSVAARILRTGKVHPQVKLDRCGVPLGLVLVRRGFGAVGVGAVANDGDRGALDVAVRDEHAGEVVDLCAVELGSLLRQAVCDQPLLICRSTVRPISTARD